MSKIEDMAIALDRAERERRPLPPLSETYPLLAATEAYAIQNALFDIKRARGTRLVGRKIGLTSQAMQQQMGVNQPDYGFLLDTMVVPPGGVLACSEFLQARIEPEVAFWLAEDLRGPDMTAEHVLSATRGVSAALELVDSRITNWRITLVDTIADNASSGRMIVSEVVYVSHTRPLLKHVPRIRKEKTSMEAHDGIVYRKTELVGTSSIGFDDGVRRAIERAQKTLRNVRWFEVKEQRGRITEHGIEYQVTLEIGFALEDTIT